MTTCKLGTLAGFLGLVLYAAGCGDSSSKTPAVDAVNTPGYLTRFAGTGIDGLGPDGLAASETDLSLPMDITFAADGTAYVVDWNNHRIRKITNNVSQTIIGSGYIGDATVGQGTAVNLNHPTHVVVEADGNLIFAAWHNSKVMRYTSTTGAVANVAGTGGRSYAGDGAAATAAVLDLPAAVALKTGGGGFYIMDQANQIIRFVDTTSGVISTFAGTAPTGTAPNFTKGTGYSGDNGPATSAKMLQPVGQSAPPAGRLVTDSTGNVFFADSGNHVIRKIDTNNVITTVAGTGTQPGFFGDGGPATAAKLNRPSDLEVDSAGNIYIADTDNDCVRRVDKVTGNISTVAGMGGVMGGTGEGGKAVDALLNRPYGVALDPAQQNLYIVDTHNHRILRLHL